MFSSVVSSLLQSTPNMALPEGNELSLALRFLPQLINQPGKWDMSEDLRPNWPADYVEYEAERMKRRLKNNEKLSLTKGVTNVTSVGKNDDVLVYRAPRDKLDVAWRSGTVVDKNHYGVFLSDGTSHSYHHTKKEPRASVSGAGGLKVSIRPSW